MNTVSVLPGSRRITPCARQAIDVIISSWVEQYHDADSPPPEGLQLVMPNTGHREVAISITRGSPFDRESLNYLVDWNRIGLEAYVMGPVPQETRAHALHGIVRTIHRRLIAAGFVQDGDWNNLDPDWTGYDGRHRDYLYPTNAQESR